MFLSSLKYSIAILLPTLVLLRSESLAGSYLMKRELFGGNDYYLDLQFSKRPTMEGVTPFSGFLADKNKESRIFGRVRYVNRTWRYEIPLEDGLFVGVLTREKNRCEPIMNYEIRDRENRAIDSGRLLAGFCS